MKVICINAGYIDSDDLPNKEEGLLIENKEYNVIDSYISEGYCWYVLEEDEDYGYDSRRFENLTQTNSAVKEATIIVDTELVTI